MISTSVDRKHRVKTWVNRIVHLRNKRQDTSGVSIASGLPPELVCMVASYLPLEDLWRMQSVCRNWRTAVLGNSLLWRHFDLTFIKNYHWESAYNEHMARSKGMITTLTCYRPLVKFGPLSWLVDEIRRTRNAGEWATMRHLIHKCPQLTRLVMPYAEDELSIPSGLWDRLKSLELGGIDIRRRGNSFKVILSNFPNLEDFRLTNLKEDLTPSRDFEWPQRPHNTLKRLSLKLLAPNRTSPTTIDKVNLFCLAKSAPNLRDLELRNISLPSGGMADVDGLRKSDFSRFKKLKVCTLEEVEAMELQMPCFPETLEKLVFNLDKYRILMRGLFIPLTLPNLRYLDTNFDTPTDYGYTPESVSAWSATIRTSKQPMEYIRIEQHKKIQEMQTIFSSPFLRIEYSYWYAEIMQGLIADGILPLPEMPNPIMTWKEWLRENVPGQRMAVKMAGRLPELEGFAFHTQHILPVLRWNGPCRVRYDGTGLNKTQKVAKFGSGALFHWRRGFGLLE